MLRSTGTFWAATRRARRQGVGAEVTQRRSWPHGGGPPLDEQDDLVEPRATTSRPSPTQPAELVEGAGPDQQGGGPSLEHEPQRRALDGEPGGEEAPQEQQPVAAHRAPGVERVERAPGAERQQDPGHGSSVPGRPGWPATPRRARLGDVPRLSGLDASFLYLETSTMHMHVCLVAVLDPATMPAAVLVQEAAPPHRVAGRRRSRPSTGCCGRCPSASTTRSGRTTPTSTSATTSIAPSWPSPASHQRPGPPGRRHRRRPLDRRRPAVGHDHRRGAGRRPHRADRQDPPQRHGRHLGRRDHDLRSSTSSPSRPTRVLARVHGTTTADEERGEQAGARPEPLASADRARCSIDAARDRRSGHGPGRRPRLARRTGAAIATVAREPIRVHRRRRRHPTDRAPHAVQRRPRRPSATWPSPSSRSTTIKRVKKAMGVDRQRRGPGHLRPGPALLPARGRTASRMTPLLASCPVSIRTESEVGQLRQPGVGDVQPAAHRAGRPDRLPAGDGGRRPGGQGRARPARVRRRSATGPRCSIPGPCRRAHRRVDPLQAGRPAPARCTTWSCPT